MKIKHGMILAAGLGKRMQPLTLKTPKPLLKIGNKTLLERSINLLINHGIEEIVVNIHHLGQQIEQYISNFSSKANLIISNEKNLLLDTGGGVKEGTKHFKEKPFLVINPDTLWDEKHSYDLLSLEQFYYKNQKHCLLLVNKKLSFDKSFKGDFNLKENIVSRDAENNFIFTGIQITNRNFLNQVDKRVFSMNEVWKELLKTKDLLGLESNLQFHHLNTFEIFKKIEKIYKI